MPSAVVCDDDQMTRQVLRGLLTDAGFSVVGEVDMAVAALDLVSVTRPDVLVLDVNMPGLSGIDIIRDVRERTPQTEIIVVSSYDVDHLDETELDVAAVMSKSDLVRFDEVLSAVMTERGPASST
ncbi:MAG TPA: response regulator [Acidimicrobiales bacterium]|jgi:DNA-binding NarL/FixJ family response regulator|nr:response regulator [Acidimicrobiales bacterium]